MNDDALNCLLKTIHENYTISEIKGIEFFCYYYDEINKIQFVNVLNCLIENFEHKFIVDFILSNYPLWEKLNAQDWTDFIKSKKRINPLSSTLYSNGYSDIYFIIKYLNVNIIDDLLKSDNLPINDKIYILTYCKKMGDLLFLEPFDEEDLDGVIYLDVKEIQKEKSKFLHSGFRLIKNRKEFIHEINLNLKNYKRSCL